MMVTAVMLLMALGGCIASFSVTAGLRAAASRPWIRGRSQCDHCETQIGYSRSIPVVSYLWARGRCGECCGPITVVHPVGESVGAILLPVCLLTGYPLQGGLIFVMAMFLLTTSVVDLRTFRLPDRLTLAIAVMCLGLSVLNGAAAILAGLAAALTTFLLLQLLRLAGRRGGKDAGLGFGDVKLLSALALWLGLATPWALALGAVAGLVAILVGKPADGRLPFGPFIAASSLAVGVLQEFELLALPL